MKFHEISLPRFDFHEIEIHRFQCYQTRRPSKPPPGVALAPSSCPLHPSEAPQTQNADDAHAQRAQQTRSDLLPTPYYNRAPLTLTVKQLLGESPVTRRPSLSISLWLLSACGSCGRVRACAKFVTFVYPAPGFDAGAGLAAARCGRAQGPVRAPRACGRARLFEFGRGVRHCERREA